MSTKILEGERDHEREREVLLERYRRIPIVGRPLAALMRWVSWPRRFTRSG